MIATAFVLALYCQDADALWKEYTAARDAFHRTVRAARDAEERQRLIDEENPASKFLPRFRELAAKAEGVRAQSAHFYVFNLAGETSDGRAASEAASALLKLDPSMPLVGDVARELQYAHYNGWKWARAWLREAVGKTANRDVKAAAMFSFAYTISGASDTTKEEREEAKAMLRTLAKDFADTPYAGQAEGQLFELENLALGCTAPDFDAKDVDGVAFKLSDYRGKVVVLDFWGFW